jgi:hypothetical protein
VARKLVCIGVLIFLASLARAAPGIASIVAFPGGPGATVTRTEIYGIDQEPTGFTVNIAYDRLNTARNITLSVNHPGPSTAPSFDLELVVTAEFYKERGGGFYRRDWEDILHSFAHSRGDTSLTLTTTWTEVMDDSNHYSLVKSFSLSLSHGDPSPTPTPLPGAVWLLGTGLLGLGCLRPRRRK